MYKMALEEAFQKGVNIVNDLKDNENLINLLTPNEVLDNIQIFDSTVEIIGYVDGIEASRTVGTNTKYKFFKFYVNNGNGRRIQIVAWNDDIKPIEQLIKTNFVFHLDGLQAREPKMNIYNNGNVRYELLIRKNTVITNLGKYYPKLEQINPKKVLLNEVANTSQCIILEAYIKTNFGSVVNNKLNKSIGCGSITDGTFKLEVNILNFDDDKFLNLNLNKGDKIELIGTMQNSAVPPYLVVNDIKDIHPKEGKMSLIQLIKAVQTPKKRKLEDNQVNSIAIPESE
ncbi:uncharacterized protein [Temnothorax longispinosus]|uniref:uncharacterized protein isoform X2 n=1 Tax=Temnothorax longispinosus TaxID=300112 RepID=UPI003A99D585